jgi:Tfp pilus assembly protein PilF
VRFAAGRVYYRLGYYPEAAAEFARVAEDTPQRRAAWYNLGLCSEREDRPDEARRHYARAIDIDASYDRAVAALARVS